ncbi:sensor histidine kinase [Reichenbachiella ulvae]|uniref:histidine kinase n=1 Tax=Reichenbachiella ulvae TaxID=2980104 RepID=A0ABT3CR76_9BACT|nr:HAMP domain-containing sensor histidine kinase [Reichenbachiella ulvae]MCV9386201.1 HAMP domain-containing histidine kinase [Reichenbachiella ulvae]
MSENIYNDLLQKQINKYTKGKSIPEEWKPLFESINDSYNNYEKELELIERVMNVSSEELLDANQELKKINEEMDRFVYSTSHDLRAPLLSILGLLNIIEKENKQYDIQGYLKLLRDSTVNLDKFISDIIDYSRNSRLEVEKTQVDIGEIINESFKHLNYLPGCSTLLKLVNIDAKEKFYSDQRRLVIIFNNLISNAIKYQNPDLTDSYINIEAEIDVKEMKLEISDNGIGIEESYLQKIFDMFYRASPDSKGSGLGLYIVKEAIQKLNGSIAVESTLGMGTKFSVVIPNIERH